VRDFEVGIGAICRLDVVSVGWGGKGHAGEEEGCERLELHRNGLKGYIVYQIDRNRGDAANYISLGRVKRKKSTPGGAMLKYVPKFPRHK
jgi:hypothetical protein